MATLIGGAGTGLLDSSLYLLNRDDRTRAGEVGHNEEMYVNVSNGALVIQHQDGFMPSRGEDFSLIRTYNSRGQWNTEVGKGWTLTVFLELSQITNNKITLINPDSSQFLFQWDDAAQAYISVDGPGAYERIVQDKTTKTYQLLRSDQTVYFFDNNGTMVKSRDTNGVEIIYTYAQGKLQAVQDDTGHRVTYVYQGADLMEVRDEVQGTLVRYTYDGGGRLISAIDRQGQTTRYTYFTNGDLQSIILPSNPAAGEATRTLTFTYGPDPTVVNGTTHVVRTLTDAEGGVTSFEYAFQVDNFNKYNGGTTKVLDALGLNRKQSNAQEYVDWRLANGYYATFSQASYDTNAAFRAQADEIAANHTTTFTYDKNGEILSVQQRKTAGGAVHFNVRTEYAYDAKENLITIVDANGTAIVTSDDIYFRDLRRDFGVVDAAGQGKLVADLSVAEKDALKERFTTHLEYDERGNLTRRTDNEDNVTTFTYTSFNKLASQTAPMGHALTTRDDAFYQEKRVELGFPASVTSLNQVQKDALLALYTTSYVYDSRQNLIETRSPGGDLTRFEYDAFGNRTRRIVFLDPADLVTATKQQVTQYVYDAFGNNISTVDAEGNTTLATFDHFGNRLSFTDGNGGVTFFTYDNDNRLTSVRDPEGNLTVNAYDSVGNRISVRDANGHTVTYVYDRNNMLLAVIDPSADGNTAKDRVTRNTYDVVGNGTAVTDANGNTTTYTFREDRRLVEVTTPSVLNAAGQSVKYTMSYAYDAVGNTVTVRDNNGNVTRYVYTPGNLVKQATDALGQVTQYSYDANFARVSVVMGAQLAPAQRQVIRFSYDEENQLIAEVDALGNTTRHAYDAPGNRISVTDALGRTADFIYDRNNRRLTEIRPAVTDPTTGLPVRYTIQHAYDANGNEVRTTDGNGHITLISFDKNDRAVLIEDANHIKTVITYDSRGNRTSVQIGVEAHFDTTQRRAVVDSAADAKVTTFTYNEFNDLVATTDGVGNALVTSDSLLYRNLRKELGFIDPATGAGKTLAQLSAAEKQALKDLFTERYAYDRGGNYVQTTDHLGRVTSFAYDAMNRVISRTDALGGVTRFAYDGNSNQVKQTDALGRVTTSTYDAVNRLVDSTDALGVVTHRAYDSFGNLTAQTRAFDTTEARSTQFVYDLNNRVVRATDPEGHFQSFEYDAVGNRVRIVDARGNATRYVYDALNRNIRIIDPLSFETRIEYNGVDKRIAIIDPRGGIQRLAYDAGDRYIETTDAEGRVTRFAYDVRGNRISQTTAFNTPQAETTTFEYDAESNMRSVTDAEGNRSTFGYDRVYNRTNVTDGNGHATSYAFDALNRQIQITDAEGGVTRYTYDAVSNRLTGTDALGRVTTYTYDARNELISELAPDGVETRYAYDRVGNRVSITRAANTPLAATTTFVYDRDDRLVAQTDPLGHTTTYQYDANHNRTVATDPGGHSTTYQHDANNRVIRITDALGNAVQYRYDGNGNRVQVIDARGFTSTTYFNGDNEVVLSVDNEGFATSFAYDANGNVTSQTLFARALPLPLDPAIRPTPATDPKDQTTRFAYDRLNRVTQRTDGEGFVTQFTYDAVGNTLQTRQGLDLAATSFAIRRSFYDGNNREVATLTAENHLAENRYDAVGNRIAHIQYDQRVTPPADGSRPLPAPGDTGHTTAYAYDANNRLVRQTSALGISTEHSYDARGNRTATTEASGTADARTTLYRYDAADRYVETVNAAGVATRLELDADGNVLARREAFDTLDERLLTFQYDGNHRVTRQTDALGVITTTSYDANGNVVSMTRAFGQPEARTETFTYDRNNRQVSMTNAAGEVIQYAYDAAGNRVRTTQAPGQAEERSNLYVYDRDNRLVQATDGVGSVTEFRYDGAGNKIETVQAQNMPDERHSLYAYDKDNRLTQITDPEGGVTRYEYDALNNQTRITDANGGVQQNTFDAIGRVVSSLSAGGVLTRNTYDRRDNILSTAQSFADLSDARTTTYAYDLLNRQTRATDGEGFSTTFAYDAFGNQTSITRGQYLVAPGAPGFDPDKAARAFLQTNSFAYDKADRLLSLTDAEGNVTAYTYDAVGNRLSMTEAALTSDARTTGYAYDLANRLIETRTPEGGLTRLRYDQVGNRIAEDQLQSGDEFTGVFIHKRFEYDDNGRLTAEIDPFLVRTEYAYDRLGNQVLRRAAANTPDERITRAEYDRNNRKTADIDGEGNRTTYAYDAVGNRTRLTDARGKVAQYFYDGSNQLVRVVDPEGFVNTFRYDAAGNQVEQHIFMVTSPDRIVRMEYDRANRLTARVEPDGIRTEVRYDGAGNKIRERLFANTAAPRDMLYQWDRDNRLVRFTDVEGTVTTFTYDGANNKLSEIVLNPADANPARATFYQYDLNNRRITETFDPSGLNIVLRTAYDKVANVVAKTDGNGNTTTMAYDLNNRVITQRDALGNTYSFGYDAVGNQIRITDPRGAITRLEYDDNNRKVREIRPPVEVFTIEGGLHTISPTYATRYDAVGNEVQLTDANGFVTTSYFDGNNRLVAQIKPDNVLCEYTYSATGEELTKTLHMTRLSPAAHDPALRPTPPAGDRRITTFEYDLAGRLTRTVHPPIAVTTLTSVETGNPVPVTITTQVSERHVYDAFGNEVESFDRNGNRAVSYYDTKNRKVAVVDAAGFLVEWDYDAQDNQIEQRVYTQPLNPALVSPSVRPTPPAGEVFVTSVRFDAASRKVEERAPQIEVFDPSTQTTSFTRPTTTYTYDDAGNELTKTLGAGTPLAITEFSYYDAANRRVAVINAGRVLHTYRYDANGNLTEQKRFFNPVPMSVNLSSLTGSTDFAALVAADPGNDQVTDFVYDALNRATRETDLMGPGTADDLTKLYRYDATTNRTSVQDEDGFVRQTEYDGAGRVARTVDPDGSGTLFEYDAAGNQILAFTGKVENAVLPPTDFQARLTEGLELQWRVAAGRQTWVAYDTFSRATPADYANRTATQFSFDGTARASISSAPTGTTLFFRFVAQDGAGNLSWSAEQSLTIPPRFHDVAVTTPDANTLEVTVRFDAGAVNPRLRFGAPGNLNSFVPFVLQADGSYKATITGVNNAAAQALSFKIVWEDAAGRVYESNERPFEARAEQAAITSDVTQNTISNGTTTSFTLNVETRVPSMLASTLSLVQARWRLAGSGAAFAATAASGVDSGQGFFTFSLVLGDATPLSAGDYEILLDGVRADGTSLALDRFIFTVGTGATPASLQSLSWTAPPAGTDQLVIIDGQTAFSERRDGRVLVDSHVANNTSTAYDVFYSTRQAQSNTLNVTSTAVTEEVPDPNNPNGPPIIVVTGFDLGITETLDPAETENIVGDLHLAWRPAGAGIDFANDVVLTSATANVYTATLPNLAAGQYDLKVYYHDAFGHEVIVQWRRVDTADATVSFTDRSHIVVARETGGSINSDGQGVITLDPGLYVGPLDTAALLAALSLTFTETDQGTGRLDADGLTTGYFVESEFNALDYKVATNENDGLWRTFGVDGNGNTVETRLLGEKTNPVSIDTFATFDARGRKLADFGAPVLDPTTGTTRRPVRRYTYDVLDKTTSDTNALGDTTRFEYNALGTLVRQTDANGRVQTSRIDLFGRETAMVSQLGNTTLKFYDLQGRLIRERDPLGNETGHRYDAFDREVARTDGLGMQTAAPDDHTTRYAYDQRDRMVRMEAPQGWHLAHDDADFYKAERERLGFPRDAALLSAAQQQALINHYSVSYAHDGRDHVTSTFYPLGQRTDELYDGNGRLTETRLFLNGSPATSRRAYDAYGNVIAEVDAEGRARSKVYGGFGRLLEEIDEDGIRVDYSYDVFGRIIREFDPNGAKNITKSYDDGGRLTSVQDHATGVSTTYTYDLTGKRFTEVMLTPGSAHNRSISYEYDRLGQMVRWADAVTGLHLNTYFDAEGNRVRAFTDAGFDPLGQGGGNANFRFVNHVYTFDDARRVTSEVQRNVDAQGNAVDTLISSFRYDAANNRVFWNNAGTEVNYVFDANARAVTGDFSAGGTATHQAWTYDAIGNVLTFRTLENGAQKSATTNTYNDANRTVSTVTETAGKDTQTITRTYDRSLRITNTVLRQGSKTFNYVHSYFGDGREKSIVAFGDANGNSTSTYDANKIRSSVNLGQGDGQDRPEIKTFTADNEGHIVSQFHDDGKSATREIREYLYANGMPVGETGNGTDGVKQVFLDSGNYALIQNLSDTHPGSVLTYTTREGDSLMAIASQMYGNPSLWFVIAEANGLDPNARLEAGRTLIIPNSVKTGHITAENHRVYSESEIVGSTLPNLKTPPPPKPKKGCGNIIMIIIVVVIAVVVSVVTAGIAAPLAAAAVGAVGAAAGSLAAFVVTAAVYAAVGAVVAAIGSIVQQGLFIALGYQEGFSWKQVGTAAVSGAFAGAAAGVGAAAQAAAAVGQLSSAGAQYAQIASAALKAGSVASKQLLEGGKITSWTSLAAAAIGQYASVGQGIAASAATYATKIGDTAGVNTALETARSLQTLTTVTNYATPWVQLAETYVRNDGKLKPLDWANAAGSTLASAVTDNFGVKGGGISGQLQNAAMRLGTNLLVAGVLSRFDRDAAQSYAENAIGQEAGQFIGDYVGQQIGSLFPPKEQGLVFDPDKNTFVDSRTGLAYNENLGAFVDDKGNPVAFVQRQVSAAAGGGAAGTGALYGGRMNLGGPTGEEENLFPLGALEDRNKSAPEILVDRIRNRLQAAGATEEQIAEVFAKLDINNLSTQIVATAEDLNRPVLLASLGGGAPETGTLVSIVRAAAPTLARIGEVAADVAEALDHPVAKYTMMAIDIASGPIRFAVTQAIMASPVGEYINNAIGLAFEHATNFIAEEAGLDHETAAKVMMGTLAVVTVGIAAAAGFKFLKKSLEDLAGSFRSRIAFLRRAEKADAELNSVQRVTHSIADANKLEPPHRGVIYVREPQGNINSPRNQWDAAAEGAASDLASGSRSVPALRYDHANPSPHTSNFVKFDGIESNGTTLIDRKISLTSQDRQIAALERADRALIQNPTFNLVIEFPNQQALQDAARIMARNNITNPRITLRVPTP